MRITVNDILHRKGKEKITTLTCYDYPTAKLLDGEVDVLLVGDSLGMVVYGFASTTHVTMEIMTRHTSAVAKGANKSFIVADLPYGSVDTPEHALRNAKLLIEAGAQAVKLEGAGKLLEAIKLLRKNNIEVMGHVGLLPQSVELYGGYKVQGRDEMSAASIINDAKELEEAGCFAIVVEAVPRTLADIITAAVNIPTIGIGASPNCDGQVLVINDMLGLTAKTAKFVKVFAKLGDGISKAAKAYAAEVKSGKFPGDENCY